MPCGVSLSLISFIMRAVSSQAAFGLGALFGQAGHDQKRVADGLVELDGLLQFVAEQRFNARVRAAAFQARSSSILRIRLRSARNSPRIPRPRSPSAPPL